MFEDENRTRRGFIALASAAAVAAPAWAQKAKPGEEKNAGGKKEDVDPPEDLMREHGLLNRVLLIYEEIDRRLAASADFDPAALKDSATMIKNFIEGYHEKLEEDHLFPRFRKAGKLVQLVNTLQAQHAAGRAITDQLLHSQLVAAAGQRDTDVVPRVRKNLQEFIRMYRPHEAREDTVLFPALRSIVSEHEFDAMGEDFEKKEHELFGKDGFEGQVARVAKIEESFGIADLAQFTPK